LQRLSTLIGDIVGVITNDAVLSLNALITSAWMEV
jgi:hypothetical protein